MDLSEFSEYEAQLAADGARRLMERFDDTRARGLWTDQMEKMWERIGELPDGDPRVPAFFERLRAEVHRVDWESLSAGK